METAKEKWKILKKLDFDFVQQINSFMVIGEQGDFVLMTTRDGTLYWFGEMKWNSTEAKIATEPKQLEMPNPVVSMAKGDDHILLLDNRGQLYSMGLNSCNNLGLDSKDDKTYFSPQLIPSPHKFVSIRCSQCHNLALTENGKVWAWGDNLFGRLGLSGTLNKFVAQLTQLKELDDCRVVDIACGYGHSLALTDQGNVYSWGWNKWGQLGWGELGEKQPSPTRVSFHLPVRSIAAGYHHTLLLTRDTESVYACGHNNYSQLGNSTSKSASVDLSKVFSLPPIVAIAAHYYYNFSVALSHNRESFVWGRLPDYTSVNVPIKLSSNYYWTVLSAFSLTPGHLDTPYSVVVDDIPVDLIEHKEKVANPVVVDDIPVDLIEHKEKVANSVVVDDIPVELIKPKKKFRIKKRCTVM